MVGRCLLALALAFVFACGEPRAPNGPTDAGTCGGKPRTVPVAPMTMKATEAGKWTFALLADGTMLIDGRPAGSIQCDDVRDPNGNVVATVRPDGSLVGMLAGPGARFEGDELVVDPRDARVGIMRTRIDDAGMLTISVSKGQAPVVSQQAVAPYEGGGKAKRAAILASLYQFYYWGLKGGGH